MPPFRPAAFVIVSSDYGPMIVNRNDFIKIDVEGMEVEVLQGAMETLQRCKPMMLIEHIKTKKSDMEKMLKRAGYKRFVLGINLLAVHEDDKIEISIDK